MSDADTAREDARPAGWPRAGGVHYLEVLSDVHRVLQPEWYLEIGSGRGNSLRQATTNCIAVDPGFRFSEDVLGEKPQLHLIRQKSQEFFASGMARKIAPKIDLAFIDGMHLFEFVLRDFIETEKLCHAGSVIMLHDLVPFSPAAAEREWDKSRTKGWSGDVWKMGPILRKHRPDILLTVMDPRPSGLAMAAGLDPENRVLERAYDAIVEEWMDVTIESYGPGKLKAELAMEPASDELIRRVTE